MIPVGLEHVIGFERSPRAGAVEGHGILVPTLANGVDDTPGFENFIIPCEEGRVAEDGIAEKTFVSFRGVGTEFAGVTELHIDRLNGAASGAFGIEAEMHALVGLEADMHRIAAEEVSEFRAKESGGGTTKNDDNF